MNQKIIEQLLQALPDINKYYFKQVYIFEYKQSDTVLKFSEQQNIPYI